MDCVRKRALIEDEIVYDKKLQEATGSIGLGFSMMETPTSILELVTMTEDLIGVLRKICSKKLSTATINTRGSGAVLVRSKHPTSPKRKWRQPSPFSRPGSSLLFSSPDNDAFNLTISNTVTLSSAIAFLLPNTSQQLARRPFFDPLLYSPFFGFLTYELNNPDLEVLLQNIRNKIIWHAFSPPLVHQKPCCYTISKTFCSSITSVLQYHSAPVSFGIPNLKPRFMFSAAAIWQRANIINYRRNILTEQQLFRKNIV